MKRPLKWWRTNNLGSPPLDEQVQGSLWFALDQDASWSGVQSNLEVTIEGVCEFTGMTDNNTGADVVPAKPVKYVPVFRASRSSEEVMSDEKSNFVQV